MDYKKAIEVLANEIGCVDLDTNNRGYIDESEQKFMDACNTAISAMHELQLYKDGKLCLIPESVYSKQCTELDAYKQLGTLEEVQESMDKQNPEKPAEVYGIFGYIEYECRECGNTVNYMDEYCKYCGKKQDLEVLEL